MGEALSTELMTDYTGAPEQVALVQRVLLDSNFKPDKAYQTLRRVHRLHINKAQVRANQGLYERLVAQDPITMKRYMWDGAEVSMLSARQLAIRIQEARLKEIIENGEYGEYDTKQLRELGQIVDSLSRALAAAGESGRVGGSSDAVGGGNTAVVAAIAGEIVRGIGKLELVIREAKEGDLHPEHATVEVSPQPKEVSGGEVGEQHWEDDGGSA